MRPPSSIELVKEIKGHVLIESVRECQKKEYDNFLGGCVSSGILHAKMLHFMEQLGNTSFDFE